MLELNKKRPIRVQSTTTTTTNHLCNGEVDWTADNRREQDLMQRLTFSSNDDCDETTNSETTATTTTTIPTSCLRGRKNDNNKNNNDNFNKKDKISKISKSLNRKEKEKRFEIRKSKHRFRLLSYLTMQKVLVKESSEKFRQIYNLLNMVSLILIVASIFIGLSIGQQQKVTAQSIQTNQRALKQQQLQSNQQANIAEGALGDNSRQQQLQLLKSANVELNRERSQRLQRDTSPAPDQSQSSSPITNNNQIQQPTCGYPGSPAHASVTFNTSHVVAGTSATYNCDNGYELLGPPRRLCQANGTWSPVGIPFCVLNVGLGKAAMQSSTAGGGSAQKAVDGSTSPYFQASTCTMTDVENNPWWYVNLLEPYLVQIVRIDFGTACCANRQKATIAVRVGNNRPDLGNNPLCNRYHGFIEEGKPLFLPCTRPAPGAFVSIHLESPSGSSLSICETFIYTDHALSIEQCPSFRDQPLGSTATYNGKCYLFHNNQALNFDNARKYCESRGGTLVDETSPALQGFLSWELYRRHRNDQLMGQYWLGAIKDTRNPSNWKWINGKDVQISFWNSLASQGNCSRFDGSKGWLWSDTDCNMNLNFICQYRPLSCGKPEKPTNSTLITKNIDNGTVIEYQCAPGNYLMGPKSRACLPTGFFSEFAPKCKYLDCQFPAMIPNGDYKLLNGTTSFQSIVNYFCNDGYQIYGKATLTCDVDERWNGPPPRCEPLLCSAPVPPSNGYVTVTSNITIPGTQATFDCRPGYELVGDQLITCSQSGSWDNSFPYCREKRSIIPQTAFQLSTTTGAPINPSPSPSSTTTTATPTPGMKPQQMMPSRSNSAANKPGGVQFSSQNGPVRTQPSSSTVPTQPPTPALPSTSSTSASLNGIAGQLSQQNNLNNNQVQPILTQSQPQQPLDNNQPQTQVIGEQQIRKPSQSSSVSQFVPASGPASIPALVVESTPSQIQSTQQPSQFRLRPTTTTTSGSSTGNQAFASSGSQPSPTNLNPTSGMGMNNRQQQQVSSSAQNKFPFLNNQVAPNQQQQQQQQLGNSMSTMSTSTSLPSATSTTSATANLPQNNQIGTYESTPLAATNSISVHSSNQANQQSVNPLLASSPSTTSTTTTMASVSNGISHNTNNNHNNHHSGVLASFSTPIRSQNTLASAKYSLDGIIAVAIFGGFIFLGAIITIIVIIIRRKSSHSSSIDAQTISTYDSNGEHNGLYRNYQQAWENLRFATPSSQPKSSGTGPEVGLMTAHVNVAPSGAMKNFATPGVAMVNHGHHLHHGRHLHGHHNLAMNGSTSSSQSSSSLGDTVAGNIGGDPPLLRGHHAHSHHLLHSHPSHHQHARHSSHIVVNDRMNQHHTNNHHDDDDDDDDDDGDIMSDQIVMSGDDNVNYRGNTVVDQQGIIGEGFRDSNELTINADTVNVNRTNGQSVARRRLYSTNSIGRSMASNHSNHRLSGNLSATSIEAASLQQQQQQQQQQQGANHNNNHHHHHHGHHHGSSSGSSQHQRLVSSSTPSTSTRSSRASPPSDDHSLEQLAYGNSWHPNVGQSSNNQQDSSSNNNSAGSGASILGANGRANMRY